MDYVTTVLLPQLLHGVVFGAALGLLALGLTVIFGLLGVMNFAHGELYMLGAYAGITVIGVTQSFWVGVVGRVVALPVVYFLSLGAAAGGAKVVLRPELLKNISVVTSSHNHGTANLNW